MIIGCRPDTGLVPRCCWLCEEAAPFPQPLPLTLLPPPLETTEEVGVGAGGLDGTTGAGDIRFSICCMLEGTFG